MPRSGSTTFSELYGMGEDWRSRDVVGRHPEMISDSHIGFDKPENTDVTATLRAAMAKIKDKEQRRLRT